MFALLLTTVRGDSDTSSLTVDFPPSLKSQFPPEGVPETPALFGRAATGHFASVSGTVVYSVPDDLDACLPINKSKAINPWPTKGVVIALVDRGSCTFVTKVRHAEEAGAHACIVVDNRDEEGLPFMADDGNGQSISIPSVLIHKNDGAKIKQAIVDNNSVIMTLSWKIPVTDAVNWELWTSSIDSASISFKRVFKKVEAALGPRTNFSPHYVFYPGEAAGCTAPDRPCSTLCTNGGRYCITNPDAANAQQLTGVEVIQENLRQICFWQYVNASNTPLLWWDYVVAYQDECAAKKLWGEECSARQIQKLGADANAVARCVTESGGAEQEGGPNTLLDDEVSLMTRKGIFFLPTVSVNDISYRGSLYCPEPVEQSRCGVLGEICAVFDEATSPPGCSTCGIGRIADACGECVEPGSARVNRSCAGCDGIPHSGTKLDNCGVCGGPGRDKCGNCYALDDKRRVDTSADDCPEPQPAVVSKPMVPAWAVIVLVLAGVSVLGLGVFCYMRRQQTLMRQDVDALLKQYLPLQEANNTQTIATQ